MYSSALSIPEALDFAQNAFVLYVSNCKHAVILCVNNEIVVSNPDHVSNIL